MNVDHARIMLAHLERTQKHVFKDIANQRFGRLTAIATTGKNHENRWCWLCQCDCGQTTIVSGKDLRGGNTRSCGCWKREGRKPVHGAASRGAHTAEYRSWKSMLQRCYNPNRKAFKDYGGRGITVCKRWCGEDGFTNFRSDMGARPTGTSLDRIDNNGDYAPGNCRWATREVQTRNRRRR